MPYHIEVQIEPMLPAPFDKKINWAICDHPATVSFNELNRVKIGKNKDGIIWHRSLIDKEKLREIRLGVMAAIGLINLE